MERRPPRSDDTSRQVEKAALAFRANYPSALGRRGVYTPGRSNRFSSRLSCLAQITRAVCRASREEVRNAIALIARTTEQLFMAAMLRCFHERALPMPSALLFSSFLFSLARISRTHFTLHVLVTRDVKIFGIYIHILRHASIALEGRLIPCTRTSCLKILCARVCSV